MRAIFIFAIFALVKGAIQYDIPLTCYPPPMGLNFTGGGPPRPIPWNSIEEIPINPCGPCVEPVDGMLNGNPIPFPSKYSSAELEPYGALNYRVYDDSQPGRLVKLTMDLYNVKPNLVITAWNSAFFPFIGPTPHPIFGFSSDESAFVDADAAVSAPASKTTQAFTSGLDDSDEPNTFTYMGNNHYRTVIDLDYRPYLANQAPLRNGRSAVAQNMVSTPEGNQTQGWMRELQAVGSEFLREFNHTTGFQRLDDNGKPILIRSPVPLSFYAIVIHNDDQTHGINPGVPTPPAPFQSWLTGDHFLFGMFDVRWLWESPPSPPTLECQ